MLYLILFIVGIIIIVNAAKRRRRRARDGPKRSAPQRIQPPSIAIQTAPKRAAPVVTVPRLPDPETERRKQFRREQAAADLIHLEQVKRDLLAAYERSGCMKAETEQAYKKRVAYDTRIRNVEKQIEKAAFIANS